MRTAKSVCLVGTTAALAGKHISDFTTGKLTLDQLYQQRGSDGRTWGQVLDAQRLGTDVGPASSAARYRVPFSVLQ